MPPRMKAPASCEDLCPAKVVRALERSFGQIPAAARELGVPIPDLRRLTWAQPRLLEEALEEHELAVQRAMGVVIEALYSDDLRRQMWASDRIMSSWLARDHPFAPARRGFAPVNESPTTTFRWADGALAADELERDGRSLPVPRYGGEATTRPSAAGLEAVQPRPRGPSREAGFGGLDLPPPGSQARRRPSKRGWR